MLKIEDVTRGEMHALRRKNGYGHVGCARDGRIAVYRLNPDIVGGRKTVGPARDAPAADDAGN